MQVGVFSEAGTLTEKILPTRLSYGRLCGAFYSLTIDMGQSSLLWIVLLWVHKKMGGASHVEQSVSSTPSWFGLQLVKLWRIRRCGFDGGRCDLVGGALLLGMDLEVSLSLPCRWWCKALSDTVPVPCLSASCHNNRGLTLWNCKKASN